MRKPYHDSNVGCVTEFDMFCMSWNWSLLTYLMVPAPAGRGTLSLIRAHWDLHGHPHVLRLSILSGWDLWHVYALISVSSSDISGVSSTRILQDSVVWVHSLAQLTLSNIYSISQRTPFLKSTANGPFHPIRHLRRKGPDWILSSLPHDFSTLFTCHSMSNVLVWICLDLHTVACKSLGNIGKIPLMILS